MSTAPDMIVAIVLVSLAFGWQGGRQLVSTSYVDAKVKAGEVKKSRSAKRAEEQA